MSRCFPYPPPNYVKADKSLIESIKLFSVIHRKLPLYEGHLHLKVMLVITWLALYIRLLDIFTLLSRHLYCFGIDKDYDALKLQKDQEQAKERRKEKKKDKKEKKAKSKGEPEKSVHREHNHKKRKYDDQHDLPGKDSSQKFAAEASVEQLEKSGLTEEHELPSSIQEPHGSPDSNQSISKRRKIESTAGARNSHGSTILRIRVPLQKHKSPEPTSANVVLSSTKTLEAISVKKEVSLSRTTTSKVLDANPVKKETTSKVQETIPAKRPTVVSFRTASRVPESIQVEEKPCFSGRTASNEPTNEEKSFSQRTIPKVPEAMSAKKETSFSLRTTSKLLEAIPAKKETSFSQRTTSRAPEAIRVNDPCFSIRSGSKVSEAIPANEVPSFSGRVSEAPSELDKGKNAHANSSSRSKSSRKAQELESQFRNLIVNWKPSALGLGLDPAEADESWLFGNSRQPRVSTDANSCGLTSTSEDLKHGNDAASSFQPRACYLPEFDMYQLPYTIPF